MIELEGVSKRFGDHQVLDGLCLEVRSGEILLLVGGSGHGKTVLLKHIIGLLRPDEGEVRVEGVSVADASEEQLREIRERVGYVFQTAALFDSMTVGENIALGMVGGNAPIPDYETVRDEVLERLGRVNLEEDVADQEPGELSEGMAKRVAIARAVARNQQCLLYDEPASGLDPENTENVMDLIQELQRGLDVTSVIVTHRLESAFRIADRVALLHDGKIRVEGTVEEFVASDDPVVRRFVDPLRRHVKLS